MSTPGQRDEEDDWDEAYRPLFLRLGWFAPDSALIGVRTRPVSLGSMEAMRLMGLSLLEAEAADLDAALETREIAAYLWLHSAPVAEVELALWDGSWRAIWEAQDEPCTAVVAAWRMTRERLRAVIRAAGIEVLPRPKAATDETPWNVVGPQDLAFKLSVIARCTGWGRRKILWRLPVAQALQIYHAELRWHGVWTVRPGRRVAPGTFDDFAIGALEEEDGDGRGVDAGGVA